MSRCNRCHVKVDVLPNGNLILCDTEILIGGTTDLILGIIASLMTLALHLHSFPTFSRILFKKKTTAQILPYQYMFAFFNCYLWFIYGFAITTMAPPVAGKMTFQGFCLFAFHGVGLSAEHMYLWIYHDAEDDKFKKDCTLYTCMSYFLCFLWVVIPSPVLAVLKYIIWPLLHALGIMMYVSPVFMIIHASQTRLVECLPIRFLVLLCLNGLAWTIYASVPQTFDPYIAISNGVGTIYAVFLLGVAYWFRFELRKITAGSFHEDGLNDEKNLLLA